MENPEGQFAKVEMMGHRTLFGRVSEVERFGAKLMRIEPIFAGKLIADAEVLINGASLYCFTPLTAAQAFANAPDRSYLANETINLLIAPPPAGDRAGVDFHEHNGQFHPGADPDTLIVPLDGDPLILLVHAVGAWENDQSSLALCATISQTLDAVRIKYPLLFDTETGMIEQTHDHVGDRDVVDDDFEARDEFFAGMRGHG